MASEGSASAPSELAGAAKFLLVLRHLFRWLRRNQQRLFENAACQPLFAEAAAFLTPQGGDSAPRSLCGGLWQGARRHLAALSWGHNGEWERSPEIHSVHLARVPLREQSRGPRGRVTAAASSSQVLLSLSSGSLNKFLGSKCSFFCVARGIPRSVGSRRAKHASLKGGLARCVCVWGSQGRGMVACRSVCCCCWLTLQCCPLVLTHSNDHFSINLFL